MKGLIANSLEVHAEDAPLNPGTKNYNFKFALVNTKDADVPEVYEVKIPEQFLEINKPAESIVDVMSMLVVALAQCGTIDERLDAAQVFNFLSESSPRDRYIALLCAETTLEKQIAELQAKYHAAQGERMDIAVFIYHGMKDETLFSACYDIGQEIVIDHDADLADHLRDEAKDDQLEQLN